MRDIRVLDRLNEEKIPFREEINAASFSSFKVGGIAELAIFPRNREELIRAVKILTESGVKYEIIGNASNLLFAFEIYEGALVFTSELSSVEAEGKIIRASCGTSLTYLAEIAARNSLSGLEFAYGIPGLVGGSVYMNAGAYGSQISAVLEYSEAYDCKRDEVIKLYDHGFGYRESVYMKRKELICLGASFRLSKGNAEEIRARMRENMSARREKQPLEFPSAGSYFKRPEGHFAGKLIEDCGLKGMRVGGAEVSEKHAGFIINRGGATAQDILELEEKIKEIVMSRYGVMLEREVRLVK